MKSDVFPWSICHSSITFLESLNKVSALDVIDRERWKILLSTNIVINRSSWTTVFILLMEKDVFWINLAVCAGGFHRLDWSRWKNERLLNGTGKGLHVADVNRWILFCPLNHSVVTYRPKTVSKYYLFNDILLYVLFGMN